MKGTGIQWCDDTVNPTSGCDGCELWIPGRGGSCYAGNFHETRLSKSLPQLYDKDFTNVRTIPDRVKKVLRCISLTGKNRPNKEWLNGLRRKIFVGDLGDIFSAAVSFEFLEEEIFIPAIGSPHDLLLLTKQPQQAIKFANWLSKRGIPWPDNIWIGTSITGKASTSRTKYLREIPALHKYLSLEPLIQDPELNESIEDAVEWLIVGGESDQGQSKARFFDLAWPREIISLGQALRIAVFVKQLGSNCGLTLVDHHGGDWTEWPNHLRVRQMPFTAS